jgi:predicted flap endonuclease-1-like 5' DNA nuclease
MEHSATYTFGTASLEIILMLLAAFALGTLLCQALRRMGVCCSTPALVANDKTFNDRTFPPTGGYTADINSLLRSSTPATPERNIKPTVAAPVTPPIYTETIGIVTIPTDKDDLKRIEGIGAKIEKVLNTAGIYTYAQLATMTPEAIKPLLNAAGSQFKLHDPKSWPYQAELAAKGDWVQLKQYQDLLLGGRDA